MKIDLWLCRTPPVDGTWRLFESMDASVRYAYSVSTPAPSTGWLAMRRLRDIPGAAAGRDAPFHYVVETDVAPEAEADFNAWYDLEHLPGLAAVPGTVHAARYHIDGATPRYHACYELASLDVFESPAWNAVRATTWSARVRPAFRHTRRTMFRRL